MLNNTIKILRKRIKALQAKNDDWQKRYYNLDAGHNRLFKNFCKLQQENEQLQAQVAQYRDALIIANNYMPDIGHFCTCGKCKRCGTDITYAGYGHCLKCARNIIDAALSDTPADYHHPADVEALRKAREALEQTKGFIKGIGCYCNYEGEYASQCQPCFIVEQIDKALAEIDKALGGAEDGSSKDE